MKHLFDKPKQLNFNSIVEKYHHFRPNIAHGALGLFRGTKMLAKIIQNADRDTDTKKPAYFNHVCIFLRVEGALFVVDSQRQGVVADRASERINDYKGGDFAFINPLIGDDLVSDSLKILLKRQDTDGILYDFKNGIKELANRRFNWNLKIRPDDKHDICSDFVYSHAIDTQMIWAKENRLAFPMDYIRQRNRFKTELIGFDDTLYDRPIIAYRGERRVLSV